VLYYFKIQDKTEVRLLLHSLVDVYGSCFSFFLHKKKEKEKEKRTRVTFATLLFLLGFITYSINHGPAILSLAHLTLIQVHYWQTLLSQYKFPISSSPPAILFSRSNGNCLPPPSLNISRKWQPQSRTLAPKPPRRHLPLPSTSTIRRSSGRSSTNSTQTVTARSQLRSSEKCWNPWALPTPWRSFIAWWKMWTPTRTGTLIWPSLQSCVDPPPPLPPPLSWGMRLICTIRTVTGWSRRRSSTRCWTGWGWSVRWTSAFRWLRMSIRMVMGVLTLKSFRRWWLLTSIMAPLSWLPRSISDGADWFDQWIMFRLVKNLGPWRC